QCTPSRFSRIVSSATGTSSRPDVYISASGDLEEPRAEQFSPCGLMGYRVNVP
ncbi:Epithelial chloride channel proteinlike, partial [Caligus rogercresseyi]